MRRRLTLAVALIVVAAWGCGSSSTTSTQVAAPSSASPSTTSPSAGDAAQPWPSGFREGFCSTVPSDLSAILEQSKSVAMAGTNGDVQGTLAAATKAAAMTVTAREHLASLPAWSDAAPSIAALGLALADLGAGLEAVITGVNTNDTATAQRGIAAVGSAATSFTTATGLLQDLMTRTGLSCP